MSTAQRTFLVAVLTCFVGVAAGLRLNMSYDLAAFLPPPTTAAQTLLTQRLGQGPGAQLIFVEIPGVGNEQVAELAATLRSHSHIRRVLPEEQTLNPSAIPAVVWQHRWVLGDLPNSPEGWQTVLEQRTDDLMFAADDDTLALIAADPALLSISAISRFAAGAQMPNFNRDDRHYLLVETALPGYELNQQTELIGHIRSILAPYPGAALLGSPVYAVDLQDDVRNEATLFSLLAGVALLLLMIYRFRSAYRVLGVALPLAAGGVAGLLTLTLVFSEVHGITLAFGFTLMGVAIDYPLHLYTHAEPGNVSERRTIWKVLRLGIASTLLAYGAFIFSGTPGLQQLGVFAFTGIVVAVLVAAWITPTWQSSAPPKEATTHTQTLRFWPPLTVLAVAVALLASNPIFNDNLASLTPVDPQLLQRDAALRRDLGVADIRYLLSVHADSQQAALEATEQTLLALTPLLESGVLSGVQSISQILPSLRTQQSRQAHLQTNGLEHFAAALSNSLLNPAAFKSFEQALLSQSDAPDLLELEELRNDPQLGSVVDTLLFEDGHAWVSLIFLHGLLDPAAVTELSAQIPAAELVDLKHTSEQMVANYRGNLLGVLAIAGVLIGIGLSSQMAARRVIWLLANTTAAVACAAAGSTLWQGGLSLFDLMALTLVAGLGLDYALFYARERHAGENQATASAVMLCALSSLIVFGILSLSSIPVLHGIGTTVSIGVATAYLLARWGRYANTDH